MKPYLDPIRHVHEHGIDKADHTGIDTRSVLGHQMHLNLQDGFLLMTTKKVHIKSIVYELL